MADTTGRIGWIDMTVGGRGHEDVSMGDYSDFSMTTAAGAAALYQP